MARELTQGKYTAARRCVQPRINDEYGRCAQPPRTLSARSRRLRRRASRRLRCRWTRRPSAAEHRQLANASGRGRTAGWGIPGRVADQAYVRRVTAASAAMDAMRTP
jgi:hypothetical protein